MNYYAKLALIILIVVGLAQMMPEIVNTFLVLVLISMLIMNAGQFSKLITALRLE